MPLVVHAIIVTGHGAAAAARVVQTLEALSKQTRRPDELTLVVRGDVNEISGEHAEAAGVDRIVGMRATTGFAGAVAEVLGEASPDQAIWMLDDNCVPSPRALELLAGSLERSPLAAIAAPKLRTATTPARIASLGVSMTRLGRSVELIAGQLDQGQHDDDRDALSADARGMLVRGMSADHLLPDQALGSVDVGLDLGVRARLSGARVVLTPHAHVELAGVDVPVRRDANAAYAARRSQLHRRLSYAPAWSVIFHWLSLLPLALWRTVVSLLDKRPGEILPEWLAALASAVGLHHVRAARRRIRREKKVGWGAIAPLRLRRNDPVYALVVDRTVDIERVSKLRFFAGGGALTVGLALVTSIIAFVPLLTWNVLGGGGLLPLRETLTGLWADTGWGIRSVGVGVVGPADPFAGVVAAIGSLTPWAPSTALVWLWLLALPLAALGGWFAATRVTERASLRATAAVVWALAPTFLTALVEPRPPAVIVHLVLPWFVFAASVAHRSWGAAGAASLILIPLIASAPVLAPAIFVLLWLGVLGALFSGKFAAAARVFWVPLPTMIFFAPLFAEQLRRGNPLAILADPGRVWLGDQAGTDATGKLALLSGFPNTDYAGWDTWLGQNVAWAALLLVPLGAIAVLAPLSKRWRVGIALFVVALLGFGTAVLAPGITLSFTDSNPVALWPGTGLSLAWVGIVGGAILVIETIVAPHVKALPVAALIALAAIICAVPAVSALARGDSALTNGPQSTLPAYVAADTRGDQQRATLVITPLGPNELATRTVWGASDTLGAQSTLVATAVEPIGVDVSTLAVTLISSLEFDAAGALAELGIGYILLTESALGAQELHADAIVGLNQRPELLRVGDTDKGVLWRVDASAQEPVLSASEQSKADSIRMLLAITVLVALLLALPTTASRLAARQTPRVVGVS
jgi:GT2 family glycosyltransferase